MGSTSHHSVLLRLWVPVAVLAHVFAAVWLVRAFQLFQPALWARLAAKIRLRSKANSQQQPDVADISPSPDFQSTSSIPQVWAPKAAVIPSRHLSKAEFSDMAASTALGSSIASQEGTTPASSGHRGSLRQTNSTGSSASTEASSSGWASHALAVVTSNGTSHMGLPASSHSNHRTVPVKQLFEASAGGRQSQRLQLTWQAISCSYKIATGTKAVLQDVWGSAAAGELQVSLCHR